MSRPVQVALRNTVRSLDPYLSLLLKETRSLESANNELRWLKEHIQASKNEPLAFAPKTDGEVRKSTNQPTDPLLKLCERRSKGEPLQYILGSQPFGELDIKCRRGVLIPRPETEVYTTYLASKICNGLLEEQFKTLVKKAQGRCSLLNEPRPSPAIKILDACSGSGCISLLLHNLLSDHVKAYGNLRIDGADISRKALELSKTNLEQNIAKGHLKAEAASEVRFMFHNIMQKTGKPERPDLEPYHIIISNPPYISRTEYDTTIPRSVRDWEPEIALVPPPLSTETPQNTDPADVFYLTLIEQYQMSMRGAFMLVMEIGDEAQEKRVLDMAIRRYDMHKTNYVSVWRDSPDARPSGEDLLAGGRSIPTEGQGKVRTVVFMRNLESISWKDEERSGS